MKNLILLLACISLTACAGGSSDSSSPAAKIDNGITNPEETFIAPTTASEAFTVLKGRYSQVGVPSNSITFNGAGPATGSIVTQAMTVPGRTWYTATCTFNASQVLYNLQVAGFPSWFSFIATGTYSHGTSSGAQDCIISGGSAFEIRSWPTAKCLEMAFANSTGSKLYCKE